jgi:perosamine synthetase
MNKIPYGRQNIDEDDILAVVEVLRSDYLTTGPKVDEFERVVSDYVSTEYAVAVNSGTAALHSAMFAVGIGPGDEVIVPSMTFAATANCVVYQGATPVFADVHPGTLLMDSPQIESRVSSRTKAIISVDFAGQACDYDGLRKTAKDHNLVFVADGCHALGGEYKGKKIGCLSEITAFSFHPVKHITTGEGGMITTDNSVFAERARNFRNHGITADHHQRRKNGSWFYEMEELGYNYRITDFQCALGMSQLKKLPEWVKRRQDIAWQYNDAFSDFELVKPLLTHFDRSHAYHLYVVRIGFDRLSIDRSTLFALLREKGICVNVHYIPVHLHPFYKKKFGNKPGFCPVAEAAYEEIVSLPIFPGMKDDEVLFVVDNITNLIENNRVE